MTAARSGDAPVTAVGPPLAPARTSGVRSLFRPGRRPLSNRTAPAPQVAAPPLDDLLDAWTTRIGLGRPPRRSGKPSAHEPAPATARPAARPAPVRDPEHHLFSGTVSVSAGPFGDLDVIGDFAEMLRSVPGVARAVTQTFDRQYVVFELALAEPTALVAAVRDRSFRALQLLHANDRIIRLKLL